MNSSVKELEEQMAGLIEENRVRKEANALLRHGVYWVVAVKWHDGYGGGHKCETMDEVLAWVVTMKRSGYGRPDNPIHVIEKHEPRVIEIHDKEKPAPPPGATDDLHTK